MIGSSAVRGLKQFVSNNLNSHVNGNLNLSCDEVQISYSGHGRFFGEDLPLGITKVSKQHLDVVISQAVSNYL